MTSNLTNTRRAGTSQVDPVPATVNDVTDAVSRDGGSSASVQTLAELASLAPLVVTIGGRQLLLLGPDRSDRGGRPQVRVWNGAAVTAPAIANATVCPDPSACRRLLAEAVTGLAIEADLTERDASLAGSQHQYLMEELRAYTIEAHKAGKFCHEGLNEFLEHFDLPAYRRVTRVTYTIEGSYLGTQVDLGEAEREARDSLRPDLTSVDHVADSNDYTVTATAEDEPDTD